MKLFEGARMMHLLDPSTQELAVKLVTNITDDMQGVTTQVNI